MDSSMITAVAAIGAVVVVAMLARGQASKRAGDAPRMAEDAVSEGAMPAPDEPDADDDDEDFDDAHAEVVAVTSDNYAIVPDTHAVRLMPPDESGEAWKPGAGHRRGEQALAMSWHAGDFTGGRVVRGEADEGPWRFEAMGRDGEYTAFVFETREGADAALAVFESRGVIRIGRDEDGNPMPPSREQFEEARRVFLETEQSLFEEDPS
ncbi:MAG: hypothetical protein U0704_11500 [Candidatus Eisenbacteria bacterium]